MKNKTCSFTGHRPQKLPWRFNEKDARCISLKKEIRKRAEKAISLGYTNFISGMAIGCDIYFAEIILELKKLYPEIKLECAIPYKAQPDRWSEQNIIRYFNIIDQCNKTLLSPIYYHGCLNARNMYMIYKSDMLIAVYDKNLKGGTYNTLS